MGESLELEKTSPESGENSPDYGGKIFPNKETEINFLHRLQSAEKEGIDGIKWGPIYFERLQFLENKKRAGPTSEQIARYYALTKLINEGGLPEESRKEFIELQVLMDKQNPSPHFEYLHSTKN